MNVAVRMPRIAAADVPIRVESVAIRAGASLRPGDPLIGLRLNSLAVTLHSEVAGTVKDVRVIEGAVLVPDRIVCWADAQQLPDLKVLHAAASGPAVTRQSAGFQLPPELLSIDTPTVRRVLIVASQIVAPETAVLEVAMGPISFLWPAGVAGTVSELLVGVGAALPNGTPVMRLANIKTERVESLRPAPNIAPPLLTPTTPAPTTPAPTTPASSKEIPELSLADFRRTTQTLRLNVLAMAELVATASLTNSAGLLRAEAAKLADPHFSVAVVGEFKRGKSTFLNALAGGEFLPSDVIPCTAFACRFQYADRLQLSLVAADGTESLSPAATRETIGAELNRLTLDPNTNLREAIIRLPLPLCRDGVDLIDTPGLNDSESMNRVTLGVLPNVDAAVLLLIPESPLSETERRFLSDHLTGRDLSRIVVVMNAKDRVPSANLPRLLSYLRSQLDRLLAAQNVQPAPLYCVSAKQELEQPGNPESGFQELRSQLSQLLFRQRGRLILGQMLQRTGRAASEALSSLKLLVAQETTSRDTFDASLNEIARQLAATRLHANQIRRLMADAQSKANAEASAQASTLNLSLLALRESLPKLLSADLLQTATTEAIKATLSSLLQEEAGKCYSKSLAALRASIKIIHEPLQQTTHSFTLEASRAFAGLAGSVYQNAVGPQSGIVATPTQLAGPDTAEMNSAFSIHVNLSLGAMSLLLLIESTRALLKRAGLSNSLATLALTKLRETYGREIEREVRTNASEFFLTAQLTEIASRPFATLLDSFNQEMKVLLDDTTSTLTALRANAEGQSAGAGKPDWQQLHSQLEKLQSECDRTVYSSPSPV